MSDTEKKLSLWMGLCIFVLSLVYTLVVLGSQRWIQFIAGIAGILLSIFLFGQAGILEYFRKKDYRNIGPGDFIVWVTMTIAAGVLINSLLLFGVVSQNAPSWLIMFSKTTGVIVGATGTLLAIVHAIMPRFR